MDTGGLRFQLASGAKLENSAGGEKQNTPGILNFKSSDSDPAAKKVEITSQMGMATLVYLSEFMKRDAENIAAAFKSSTAGWKADFPETDFKASAASLVNDVQQAIKSSASAYDRNLGTLAACLQSTVSVSGDETYVRGLLRRVKPLLQELHQISLKKRTVRDSATEAAYLQVRDDIQKEVDGLRKDVALHVARLQPGLMALRSAAAGVGRVDPRMLNCSAPPEDKGAEPVFAQDLEQRPYIAMLYAALLQIDDQELAAIDVLDDWLRVNDARLRSDSAGASGLGTFRNRAEAEIVEPWYRIRVYATEYWLFETLFRREPNQPSIIRDAYIKLIERYIEILESTDTVREKYARIFDSSSYNLVEDSFQNDKQPSTHCPSDITDNDVRISTALLNAKVMFVRNVIRDGRFIENYLPRAKEYAEEAVNADPVCLNKAVSGAEGVATIRADNLQVYAEFRMALAAARRPVVQRYKELSEADISMAQNALILARSIVDRYGNPDVASDTSIKRVSQSQASNRSRQIWDELTSLIRSNQIYLDQLQ
ncbi:hypothetical protein [Mesorhizobium sp. CN2-181]|uniref:hypothetical protein n=1 Tax=Mesorhizobium yinganensis TaxID=3157707 RepID=UPI0032B77144